MGGGGNDDPQDSTVPYEATLSNCPRSLFELWQEYEFGLQGRKAAKRLTSREREEELNTSITGERWCGIRF